MEREPIIQAGGLLFGQGLPKICVPLTEGSLPALLEEAARARALPGDFCEWRIDSFWGDPLPALGQLRSALGDMPLLCTLRTRGEGGAAACSPQDYEGLLAALLEAGGFQLLDVELSCGEERCARLCALARGKGVAPVVSKHDFEKTPPAQEIAADLCRMKGLGAALPKYAVTPRSPGDVLALLAATWEAYRQVGPVITMAMGEMGKVSRAAGGLFGSCVTFGAGQNASAPGQIGAGQLRSLLEELCPGGAETGKDFAT